MANYLLDTNHLSPLVTFNHPLRQYFIQRQQQGDVFTLTVPALAELLFGLGTLPRARQNLAEWDRLRAGLTIYDLDRSDAEKAAGLQLSLRRRGRQLETVDALIAAVALRYDLTLLTTDRDFAAIPDLPQENWIALIRDA
jgi:tRNA(fMet)-specific endonuclease VapC